MWNAFEKNKEILSLQYKTDHWQRGEEPELLKAHVRAITDDNVSVQKAKRIAYLLKNVQIDICPAEIFADKINHGQIMWDLFWENYVEVRHEWPEEEKMGETAYAVKSFNINLDFGHIGPDWDFLMEKGIVGVIDRLKEQKALHPEKSAYYDSGVIVYEGIIALILRYAELAETIGGANMEFLAENLRVLSKGAPQNLAQAMELSFLMYRLLTHVETTSIRSLGGIDRLYAPFVEKDLAKGTFTEENIRELTARFLWRINAMNVTANMAFYICREDSYKAYSKIILEEYRKLDIFDPKLHVMYHENMDREVLDLILEMIREGKNSFVFINTAVVSESLEAIGVSPEDAAKVTVYGCYETAAEGTEVPCTCGGMFNLAKSVEFALNNGTDMKTGIQFGPQTGEGFVDFDGFLDAVKSQLLYSADLCMDIFAKYESSYCRHLPTPMISSTYETSVMKGIDLYDGGAKYNNTSVVGAGLATLVDSVMMVKKLVFEEKKIGFAELRDCLKNNWEGYENLRNYSISHPCKYGNNIPEADDVAVLLTEAFQKSINNRPNGRGGVFRCGLFSVDWRFWMGNDTAATADGRLAGEPISKNTAASIGRDKQGVTALMHSMLKLDSVQTPDGYVADIALHESAVRGEEGMIAFKGLLLAFMKKKGFSVHFNVLSPEVLKQAQAEPEKHRNIQIRLCGWNVRFVDLSKRDQDEFILQSENRY